MIFTITGLHGCGKTTQIKIIQKKLVSFLYNVYVSKALEKKDSINTFLKPRLKKNNLAVTFIFIALYIEQKEKFFNALSKNKIVLCDRWDDVFNAYHKKYGLLAKDEDLRSRLSEVAFGGIVPNKTYYLKLTTSEAMDRCKKRKPEYNINKLDIEYQNELLKYFEYKKVEPSWVTIDANISQKEISEIIISDMLKTINSM